MAADRGAFIDQSQSLNIFIAKPSLANITSMHFYGWKKVVSFFNLFGSSECAHTLKEQQRFHLHYKRLRA